MQRWYITFHGGEDKEAWNNIHAFDLDGQPVGKALDTTHLPDEMGLRELRGFAFAPEGDLFVTNAWQGGSHILRFEQSLNARGRHDFREVFVSQQPGNPGLAHPFDVAFGPDGHLFVPSQDTNVVGRYFGPAATATSAGSPMPLPPAVQSLAIPHLLPGTFVPSKHHANHGLAAVRGAIFGPSGHLYVVDRDENAVKVYDGSSGSHLQTYHHHHLGSPIHILPHPDGRLLVGSRDRHAVVAIDPKSGQVDDLIEPGAGGLRSPSGMAFGPDGSLYVASRDTRQVLRFDADSGKPDHAPFIDHLHDLPEFLHLVTLD